MDLTLETAVGIALGIGLAAATGFRIFVPMLVAGLAARAGWLSLNDGFAWLASTPALITLGVAAAVEALAYLTPGVDHVLDIVAGPAAVVAGVLAGASVMTDLPPAVLWPLAIIAGGGAAGLTKGGSALVRANTGIATLGMGNPVISAMETVAAAGLAVLAVIVPFVCLVAVIVLLVWAARRVSRLAIAKRRNDPSP